LERKQEARFDAIDAKLEEATRPEPFADAMPGDVIRDDAPLIEISLGTGKKPS
jgi:hypothetical protein